MYFELTPAYGRDYARKADVIAAFHEQKDFVGDYNLGFKIVNKSQLPPGSKVILRYKKNRLTAMALV